MFGRTSSGHPPSGGGLMRRIRQLVLLAFAVVQLVLVARILLDLGVIPEDWRFNAALVSWSDAIAAPVRRIASGIGLGGVFGGGGLAGLGLGQGLNPVMIGALFGWTVVEGLVMRVVGKFAAL